MFSNTLNSKEEMSEIAVDKIRESVSKFIGAPIGVVVNFAKSGFQHKITAKIIAGPINSVVATAKSDNIFKSIDLVVDKIESQLKKKKKFRRKNKVEKLRLAFAPSVDCQASAEFTESSDWQWEEVFDQDDWRQDQEQIGLKYYSREYCGPEQLERNSHSQLLGGVTWNTYL